MMSTVPANHFNFKIHHRQIQRSQPTTHLDKSAPFHPRRNLRTASSCSFNNNNGAFSLFKPRANCPCRSVCSWASSGDADAASQSSAVSDMESTSSRFSSSGDTYLPLLIRMLGLDNDNLDREQAVIALWKYSLGGKHFVDNIMQFRGCVNLTVNLLRSESSQACEAAAGLLRMISSINSYRDIVAESGAVEETTALLRRFSLGTEVKEQSICMLWNLSADEKHRMSIANSTLLPLLVQFLDDEDIKVVEAAGGVLANLALSRSTHKIMVETDTIPKLAKFLTNEVEGTKVIKKEAKNVLLELAKDEYHKILVMEEGLVLVPLVGAAAYASFRPALYSWPSLPDGTELRRSSMGPSRYGASELLLGLNVEDNSLKIDEIKMNAIVGRTQQQFLARVGAIEIEDEKKSGEGPSTILHQTLLPCKDGIARLVLILELQDETAISRAAEAISAASVNEHMRISFKEAGAVKHLVFLLNRGNDAVRSAVMNALEKLSVSNAVCRAMVAEGVMQPLLGILKDLNTSENLMEKALGILASILDPDKEMKLKFYDGPVIGSRKVADSIWEDDALGPGGIMEEMKSMMDSMLIGHLADIFKSAPSNLQSKVASILEFVAMIEPCVDTIISINFGPILIAIFEQQVPQVTEASEDEEPHVGDLEEAGLAISAASRLLNKLLDYKQFCDSVDSSHFTKHLRRILKSDIPLLYKDWVAACLVKLSFFSNPYDNPIITEVTIHETIPRLIEQIKTHNSSDSQEAAVVELNRIFSEGVIGATRAVASHGGIFPLVKLIEQGSERAVEAGLAVLYNLSMDSENHSAIIAAGATPVLRRIVLSERPHWMRALHLLRNLPV